MVNPNKQRGDRAERAVRDFAGARYPGSFKTRAGFDDDLGDVIVEHPAGRVVAQVKDVGAPKWREWYDGLKGQVQTCLRKSQRHVLGGVIVWKYRGKSDPAHWHAVVPFADLLDLLDNTYAAGHAEGYDRRAADEYTREHG